MGRSAEPRPGLADVARRAGVSTATASRALRGLARVHPATRAAVLAAAEEIGYAGSPSAAALATGRTGVVAVLVPYVARWFFAHVLDAVEGALRRRGLHVLLLTVGTSPADRTLLQDRRLLHGRVDAVLVVSCDLRTDEVALLRALRAPVATVGVDVDGWDRVATDDVATADTATTHLLDLGHRRLALVGGDPERDVHLATAVDRAAGVHRALARAGVPVADLPHVLGDWTVEGGRRAAAPLLAGADRPTAVVAASDEMAVGVLRAAAEQGLRVPEDLSVVGVDDHQLALSHGLTTVAQPVARLGATAADLLAGRLGGEDPAERRQVLLPTRLVVRASTAPPQT